MYVKRRNHPNLPNLPYFQKPAGQSAGGGAARRRGEGGGEGDFKKVGLSAPPDGSQLAPAQHGPAEQEPLGSTAPGAQRVDLKVTWKT